MREGCRVDIDMSISHWYGCCRKLSVRHVL